MTLLDTLPGEADDHRGYKTGNVKTDLTSFRKSKNSNRNRSRASQQSNEPSTVKIQSRQPEDLVMQSTYTIKGGETGDIPKMAIVTATLVTKGISSVSK